MGGEADRPVLGVDYGTAVTVAVLSTPDGTWRPVVVDGSPVLPSAVAVGEDGQPLVGQAAVARLAVAPHTGAAEPRRWLRPDPAAHSSTGGPTDGSTDVDSPAVIAAAATLVRVAASAAELLGQPPEPVRLVVPATWGPRRRTLLRRAAHRAGLVEPQLVTAPVAVAEFLTAVGQPIPADGWLVIVNVGTGVEATAVTRVGTTWEVLAAQDADAGSRAVETALAGWLQHLPDGRLNGGVGDRVGGGVGAGASDIEPNAEALLTAARHAMSALTAAPATTVAGPDGTPVVISTQLLEQLAGPSYAQIAATVRQVLDAADSDPARCAGLFLVGGGATLPGLARTLATELQVPVAVAPQPKYAAVLGAVHGRRPAATSDPVWRPPQQPGKVAPVTGWQILTGIAPFLIALALLWQMITTAETGGAVGYTYVLANEGSLVLAGLFTMAGILAHGLAWAVAILATGGDDDRPPGVPEQGWQIATGLLAATGFGMAAAALLGWIVGLSLDQPTGPYVRWTILPLLPLAACIAGAAALALRSPTPPAEGWHTWLSFPITSVLCTAGGMLLLLQASFVRSPWLVPPSLPGDDVLLAVAGRLGACLFAVGLVTALTTRRRLQIIGLPLAIIFCVILIDPFTINTFAVFYAVAVTASYGVRLWRYGLLQRRHRQPTTRQPTAGQPTAGQPVAVAPSPVGPPVPVAPGWPQQAPAPTPPTDGVFWPAPAPGPGWPPPQPPIPNQTWPVPPQTAPPPTGHPPTGHPPTPHPTAGPNPPPSWPGPPPPGQP